MSGATTPEAEHARPATTAHGLDRQSQRVWATPSQDGRPTSRHGCATKGHLESLLSTEGVATKQSKHGGRQLVVMKAAPKIHSNQKPSRAVLNGHPVPKQRRP